MKELPPKAPIDALAVNTRKRNTQASLGQRSETIGLKRSIISIKAFVPLPLWATHVIVWSFVVMLFKNLRT
jgi:hypothetical protein